MIENRLLRAIRAIVQEIVAPLQYRGFWRYRVISQTPDGRFILQALSKNVPDLVPCKARPGAAGFKADLALGSEVLVAFEDGAPDRPVIVSYSDKGDSGFKPDASTLDAETTVGLGGAGPLDAGVARVGDAVTSHTFAFNPGSGGATLTIDGTPIGLTPTPIGGVIIQGSTKVRST